MININKKQDCCGCYGCINVCSQNCIEMKNDNEGFWYPDINKNKCINCALCEKVCPVINNVNKKQFKVEAYACKNNNEKVRVGSSSGGIFTLLCQYAINNNGVVFGATFDKEFNVVHSYCETMSECEKFRGSKYVQSSIGNTYKQAKKFLNEGRIVLFSGTQCQIKGLNLYLGKKYKNLIAVDIVCHGVPSPAVFKKYKLNLEKKYNSSAQRIAFREKNKGWKLYSVEFLFKNLTEYRKIFINDVYMKGFLKDLYLRPSCYECKAKNYSSGSDIVLADYWGVQNKHPEFDDDKGVSLILISSQKGKEIFNKINNNMSFLKTDLDYAVINNSCIIKSVKYNNKREEFFYNLNKNHENIELIIEKCCRISFYNKIKIKVFGILSKVKRAVLGKVP